MASTSHEDYSWFKTTYEVKLALNTCEGRVIQLEKRIFVERRDHGTTTELFDLELERNHEKR